MHHGEWSHACVDQEVVLVPYYFIAERWPPDDPWQDAVVWKLLKNRGYFFLIWETSIVFCFDVDVWIVEICFP